MPGGLTRTNVAVDEPKSNSGSAFPDDGYRE